MKIEVAIQEEESKENEVELNTKSIEEYGVRREKNRKKKKEKKILKRNNMWIL